MPLFVWINVVNSQVMRAQDGIALLRDRPNAAMSDKDIADLKRVADRAMVGSKLLLRYVRETLKVTVYRYREYDSARGNRKADRRPVVREA